MSLENVKEYLAKFNMEKDIKVFNVSSATVELAAKAVGCEPQKIAKSLTFSVEGGVVMIVCAGDVKIDNSKFKETFKEKAKMLKFEEVEQLVGHQVGGVCPFAIKEGVKVYLDESLKRFDVIYPACGSSNSAIELTVEKLSKIAENFNGFVDVCKLIDAQV